MPTAAIIISLLGGGGAVVAPVVVVDSPIPRVQRRIVDEPQSRTWGAPLSAGVAAALQPALDPVVRRPPARIVDASTDPRPAIATPSGPIVYRNKTTGSANPSTGDVTFTDPGNAGDLLIAVFSDDNVNTWASAGWTQLASVLMTFDTQQVAVFYKKQSAGGGGTITFTGSPPSVFGSGYTMYAYSGCDPINPINVLPIGTQDTPTQVGGTWLVTSPSIGPTTLNGCMLISIATTDQFGTGGVTVGAVPSGYTQRDFLTDPPISYTTIAMAESPQSLAGATGAAVWTLLQSGGSAEVTGFMIALAPASVGAVSIAPDNQAPRTTAPRPTSRLVSGGDALPIALAPPALAKHAPDVSVATRKNRFSLPVPEGEPLPAVLALPPLANFAADVSTRVPPRLRMTLVGSDAPPSIIASPPGVWTSDLFAPPPPRRRPDMPAPPTALPPFAAPLTGWGPPSDVSVRARARSVGPIHTQVIPSKIVVSSPWGYEPPWAPRRPFRGLGAQSGEPLRAVDLTHTGIVRPPLWSVVQSDVLSVRDLNTGGNIVGNSDVLSTRDLDAGGRVVDTSDRTGLIGDT